MLLSDALRERTAEAHRRAEEARFIEDLLNGAACRGAFAALVRQHLDIYSAIEETIEEHYSDHPMIAPVLDRRLLRSDALRLDLAALASHGHPEQPVLPATAAYTALLRSHHTPEMTLANHYVRYLGDLSGGQIVARMVERHYGVEDDGLRFYRFEGIDKIKTYRDGYRARLDSIELTPEQRNRVLAEAERAFELNRQVFLDLTASRVPTHTSLGIAS